MAVMKLRAGSDYRWEREEVVKEVGDWAAKLIVIRPKSLGKEC